MLHIVPNDRSNRVNWDAIATILETAPCCEQSLLVNTGASAKDFELPLKITAVRKLDRTIASFTAVTRDANGNDIPMKGAIQFGLGWKSEGNGYIIVATPE